MNSALIYRMEETGQKILVKDVAKERIISVLHEENKNLSKYEKETYNHIKKTLKLICKSKHLSAMIISPSELPGWIRIDYKQKNGKISIISFPASHISSVLNTINLMSFAYDALILKGKSYIMAKTKEGMLW